MEREELRRDENGTSVAQVYLPVAHDNHTHSSQHQPVGQLNQRCPLEAVADFAILAVAHTGCDDRLAHQVWESG